MCSAPPKLLTYYSNKVNIYDSCSFIPLPSWNSCPPPQQIYLMPEHIYPPAGPYMPSVIAPIMPPTYYAGEACGNTSTPCGSCGPCGR